MTHANATLTPAGRLRLARLVVDQRWSYARAAERFSVSITTVRRWAGRYRHLGVAGMVDRSSRPHHSPNRLPQRIERRIVKLRVTRRWGPARIAYHLGLNSKQARSRTLMTGFVLVRGARRTSHPARCAGRCGSRGDWS